MTCFKKDGLMTCLKKGKRVEENDGYIGKAPEKVKYPYSFANPKESDKCNREFICHKTVNKGSRTGDI